MRTLVNSVYRRISRLTGLNIYLINSRALSQKPLTDLPTGHEIRRVSKADQPAIVENPQLMMSELFLEQAFTRGDQCIGYFVDDSLVSYFWCGFRCVPAEPGLEACIGADYSYAYKANTLSEFRGQRLQEALTHHNDYLLLEDGLTHNIEYIDFANLAQQRASERYGNKTIGYVLRLKNKWVHWLIHSPGTKRNGFRFVHAHE